MSFDDVLDAWFAFKKKLPPIKRQWVKLAVPTAGLFALYLGGWFGLFVGTRGKAAGVWYTELFWAAMMGLPACFTAMQIVDGLIGKEADHVDLLKSLFYMLCAAVVVLIERLIGERLGVALPAVLENLLIWGAGVVSIWELEPGFPGWKSALLSLWPEPGS